jgi:hypothetical protein
MLIARPTTLAGIFDAVDQLPGAHLLAALSAEAAASTG